MYCSTTIQLKSFTFTFTHHKICTQCVLRHYSHSSAEASMNNLARKITNNHDFVMVVCEWLMSSL